MSAARRILALGVALSTIIVGLAVPNVAQATSAPPTAAVVPAADPVPGQYLVTLDGTPKAAVSGEAEQLADRYDAGVLDVYDTALVGFSARMSPDDAQRLAADPRVALVEQDGYVQASDTQPTPGGLWGLDRIDQRDLPVDGSYTYANTATNVHAYVLDTGLYLSHGDFAGRVDPGVDFVDGGAPADCSGHGTHVTGTLGGTTYGVAKGVRIVPVRVLDCGGQGTFSNVIAGVNWVTQNAIRPAVANMSLGGTRSQTLDNAIGASINSRVTYTVAAGNNRHDSCLSSPGDRRAIVVGASTQTDTRAEFSNWGSCVDLFAPGDRILSDFLGGGTATASGTSMAAPHVAGAAALYLAGHPLASVEEVTTALACTATIGHVTDTMGSLNVLLDTQDLTATAPLLPCTPVPDPPASGIGTVHLSWQTAVGALPIEQFRIYRGTASGAETLYRTLPGTTSSYDDLTGAAGTWFYRITALDARGESPPSAEVVGTATAPALNATPLALAAHLEWTNAPDAGPAISRFDVFQGDAPGGGTIIASLPPTQTTFDVQLPGPETQRFFVVKAVKPGPLGMFVSTPSNEIAVTPVPGAPPGAPVLSASAGNKRANLSWTVPPSNDGTGAIGSYKVLRGTTAGGEALLATVPGTQTSYTDSALANGTAYYYKVVASTAAFGDGSASNEQVVVPSALDVAFLTPSASVELRRVDGDAPGPTLGLGGTGTSNPAVVSNANGTFVFVRGGDNRLYWQRILNGIPMGWNAIAGTLTSDPIAVADGTNISIFVRGGDNAVYRQLIVGLSPQGWLGLGGGATSNIAAAVSGTTTLAFTRGGDNALYMQRIVNGVPQGWSSLGGLATSDPAAAVDAVLGVTVFVRGLDNALYRQHVTLSGTPGGWVTLGGSVTSNPSAVYDGGGVHVAVRGADNAVWSQRLVSLTSAPGWASLGGSANADPALAAGSGRVWTVARSNDNGLYWQQIQPSVSGWRALGGQSSTEPAAASVP